MAKPHNEKSEKSEEKGHARSVEPRRSQSLAPYLPMTRFGESMWPLSRLRTEFDRLFEDFFRGWGSLATEERETRWGLEIDDQDDKIVVRADAPGFEPDDFDIQVRGDQLSLCACESEEQKEGDGRRWRRREYYRSLPLPADVDPEKVDAEYHSGVLTITLPKSEQARGRRIEVKG